MIYIYEGFEESVQHRYFLTGHQKHLTKINFLEHSCAEQNTEYIFHLN